MPDDESGAARPEDVHEFALAMPHVAIEYGTASKVLLARSRPRQLVLSVAFGCSLRTSSGVRWGEVRVARTNIELAKLIQTVADELRSARDSANKDDPIIDLDECELEMAVEVTNEAGVGIRVWVFELGGKRSKLNSNTVRVKFAAHDRAGPIAFRAVLEGPERPPLPPPPGG